MEENNHEAQLTQAEYEAQTQAQRVEVVVANIRRIRNNNQITQDELRRIIAIDEHINRN